MVREILEKKMVSIPEVKEILDRVSVLDVPKEQPPQPVVTDEAGTALTLGMETDAKYYLRSTHEYARTFSKIDAKKAKRVVETLVAEGISEFIAIQIANIDPDTVEELALFFEKGTKRLSDEEMEKLLYKIREAKE
nr:hypothetical protein [Candidatus Sigynarchaeota archaeon]